MRKTILSIAFAMIFAPNLFAATLTANTVPYVCQGGVNPQLCNSNLTTNTNGVVNHSIIFTSSGTFVPTFTGTVFITGIGAGGNGGGSGSSGVQPGSGGASGYMVFNYPYSVTSGTPINVIIGTAGGANTSFGTITLANGLNGNTGGKDVLGGQLQAGVLGLGIAGYSNYDPNYTGWGASTPFGVATIPQQNTNEPASPNNTGAGGSGALGSDGNFHTGGQGGSGLIIVQW